MNDRGQSAGPWLMAGVALGAPLTAVGFRWRVEQFALPIPLPDVTVFSRDSFSPRPSGPAWGALHGASTAASWRPPAPFGWGSRTKTA